MAYYEIFDNYLVLYWMGFASNETKNIQLDLKADIPGTYVAKACNTYLYYTPEHKHWNEGLSVEESIALVNEQREEMLRDDSIHFCHCHFD